MRYESNASYSFSETIITVIMKLYVVHPLQPIPVAARSKAWVFGRSLARIVGSNPTGGMDVCLL